MLDSRNIRDYVHMYLPWVHVWPLTVSIVDMSLSPTASMVDMSVPLYTRLTTHCVYWRHVSLDPSMCEWPLTVSMEDMPVRLYTCMITRCIYSRHVSLDPSMYEWPLTVLMEDLYVPPLYMHGHSLCLW